MDDPVAVREQYASEENLRARQRLWANVVGENARIVLARIMAELEPRAVLEVGGGQGELAEWMQVELGATVSFVDQSARMVELARARGVVDARVGDVQALPFVDGRFDTVVAAWMLYHVRDIDRGLAEIARVLEPGGKLVAVTNSVRHLEELRGIFETFMKGYEDRFNSENAETMLQRYFSRIERTEANVVAVVEDRDVLEDYRRSLQFETQPIPDEIELPFRVRGRTTIFVATK
jgi:ubiquinone/menaquinone biosynthesis C-methylase UbiE